MVIALLFHRLLLKAAFPILYIFQKNSNNSQVFHRKNIENNFIFLNLKPKSTTTIKIPEQFRDFLYIPIIFLISTASISNNDKLRDTAIEAAAPAASPIPTQIGIARKLE